MNCSIDFTRQFICIHLFIHSLIHSFIVDELINQFQMLVYCNLSIRIFIPVRGGQAIHSVSALRSIHKKIETWRGTRPFGLAEDAEAC